jgi:hypothetical protein
LLATEAPARGRTTSVVEALHDIAQRAHRRSLVVILSDMLDSADREDEVFDALQHLRFNKHDIILFHVVDRKHELELDLRTALTPSWIVETGEQVKAHPAEVRDAYKDRHGRAVASAEAEVRAVPDRSGRGGHQCRIRADAAGVPDEAGTSVLRTSESACTVAIASRTFAAASLKNEATDR